MPPETSRPATPGGQGHAPSSGAGSALTVPGRSAAAGGDRKSALEGLRRLGRPRNRGGGGGGRPPSGAKGGGGGGGLDLRNTWQILVGSILVPLGIVFILMAWYGAAHTSYVQQQIPYLVSGSFVGLGCLVLGGLLYWAHWLYRLYDQADLHHEEQLRALEQMVRVMADRSGNMGSGEGGAPVTNPGGTSAITSKAPAGQAPPPPPAAGGSPSYVVTPSGSVYHLPSCPVISHHAEGLRVLGPAGVADMDPCRICLPDPA